MGVRRAQRARAPLPAVVLLRARRAGPNPRRQRRERAHREIVQRFLSRSTGLRARGVARGARTARGVVWDAGGARGDAPLRIPSPHAAHRRLPHWEMNNDAAVRKNDWMDYGSPHTGGTARVERPSQPTFSSGRTPLSRVGTLTLVKGLNRWRAREREPTPTHGGAPRAACARTPARRRAAARAAGGPESAPATARTGASRDRATVSLAKHGFARARGGARRADGTGCRLGRGWRARRRAAAHPEPARSSSAVAALGDEQRCGRAQERLDGLWIAAHRRDRTGGAAQPANFQRRPHRGWRAPTAALEPSRHRASNPLVSPGLGGAVGSRRATGKEEDARRLPVAGGARGACWRLQAAA